VPLISFSSFGCERPHPFDLGLAGFLERREKCCYSPCWRSSAENVGQPYAPAALRFPTPAAFLPSKVVPYA
jgi:hypothetical protein